jgi:molecular chaperone GrpE
VSEPLDVREPFCEPDEPEPPAEHGEDLAAVLVRIEEALADLRARTARLEEVVEGASRQIGFVPPQVRQLGSRIDGLVASISEPRLRQALLGLIGIFDLVEQMETALEDGDSGRPWARGVLRRQLRQILEANGLDEIPAEGAFDPQLHRALESVPVDDPARDGHVLAVVRPGFRSGRSVLRYAEVSVGRWSPPESPPPESPSAGDGAPGSEDAGDLPA